MSEIVARDTGKLTVSDNAKRYIGKGKSRSTLRVYATFLAEFESYTSARGVASLPASPAVVADYAAHLADERQLRPSSISAQLSAIRWAHQVANVADPCAFALVRETLSGIKRTFGTRPDKKKAVTVDELRAMVATLDTTTVKGVRDRALLLVGFAGAFRRSELVGLDVASIEASPTDVTILVERSKTDQEAEGRTKTLPRLDNDLCPVAALEAWLSVASITTGAVFRRVDRWGHVHNSRLTGQTVALVVKSAARDAGLDARRFAGHSLRSGFVTSAFDAGASEVDVADVTHHTSVRVLRSYRQDTGVGGKRAVRLAFGEQNDQK